MAQELKTMTVKEYDDYIQRMVMCKLLQASRRACAKLIRRTWKDLFQPSPPGEYDDSQHFDPLLDRVDDEIYALREAIMHADALGFEEFTEERGWINVIETCPEKGN